MFSFMSKSNQKHNLIVLKVKGSVDFSGYDCDAVYAKIQGSIHLLSIFIIPLNFRTKNLRAARNKPRILRPEYRDCLRW